jgi:large subunit ribosomal protein L23
MKTAGIQFKPVTSEKAVMLVEKDNVLTFLVSMKYSKDEIKKQFEEVFDVKVKSVRTLIRDNKKIVYIQLNKDSPAIDLATKIGII